MRQLYGKERSVLCGGSNLCAMELCDVFRYGHYDYIPSIDYKRHWFRKDRGTRLVWEGG
jgi:hypothetical protein